MLRATDGLVDGRLDSCSSMQCNATIGKAHASANRLARVDGTHGQRVQVWERGGGVFRCVLIEA
jgi:hypothetical protein